MPDTPTDSVRRPETREDEFHAARTDRVVFGGDWPVCNFGASLGEWVAALRKIVASRPEEDQAKLLAGNAERLYGVV